ncbi:MAG: hypothetical protein U0P45_13030 [Acidimicrobiales bacterium]
MRALQDQVAAGQQAAALAGTAVQALYVQALLGRHPLRGADLAMLTDALQDLVSRAMGADGGTDG